MKKIILTIVVIVVAIGLGIWWLIGSEATENGELPNYEEAEVVGYGFIVDFLAIAPPISDEEATSRVYETLSSSAKEKVSRDNISADMASFVGIQDIPDQGMSVEDIQIVGDDSVTLVLGLNYFGGKVIREINMIIEEGEWKVDSVAAGFYEPIGPKSSEISAIAKVVSFAAEQAEVEENQIEIISAEQRHWPNGCLGLAEEEEMCTQAIVPGYEVILEVAGEIQAFRTDEEGSVIRQDKK